VGQVLAIIENASLDAGLDRALAEFARAKASASEMKVLQAVGAVSERELADAEYTLANARATRDEAQKSQGFTRIVSPIDGTLSIREVRYGEIAGAGSRAFQVVDLARLRVIVQLPERDLSRVREGLSVVLIPTYDPSVQVPARVVRVAPVVDPTSGTFRVTIALEATQATIRPGQFVSVRIEVGRHDDTLIVPRVAVLYDEGEPYVFVLAEPDPEEEDEEEVDSDKEDDGPGFFARLFGGDEDSDKDDDKDDDEDEGNTPERIVKRVDIETGFVELQRAEVSSGLELGDQVVTVGHETLRDGASVRLVGDEKEGEDGDAAESNSEQESDAEAEG
jgi:membrane fusion protein (multidrug efflux system)